MAGPDAVALNDHFTVANLHKQPSAQFHPTRSANFYSKLGALNACL